ncbi:hypothetical protein ACFYZB_11485 [Streptomyces sp. NPDC001852]|uniref:hypothetical protein n=1 Tax=Streptomyces sp. NPDC001852 TaxID=3364619 RepID=UPI0036A178BE
MAWARLVLLALVGSVLVLLVTARLKGRLWVLIGVAAAALTAAGLWCVLAHPGVRTHPDGALRRAPP